jgi:ABC-type transport system involved in multi-copper enzyme maturation permease subunit
MGGAKRSSLLLAHAAATALYSLLLSAWVLLILGVIAVAFPHSGGLQISDQLQMIGVSVLTAAVFALIAFSIGTFFAEVGIAVAISIVSIFAADLISALLAFLGTQVSWLKGAERGMVTNALNNLEQSHHLVASALIVAGWIVVCLSLAWLRVSRRDY